MMRLLRTGKFWLIVLLAVALASFGWNQGQRRSASAANCHAGNAARAAIVNLLADLISAKNPGAERDRLLALLHTHSTPGGPLGLRNC